MNTFFRLSELNFQVTSSFSLTSGSNDLCEARKSFFLILICCLSAELKSRVITSFIRILVCFA